MEEESEHGEKSEIETDWLVKAALEKFGPQAIERRISEEQKKLKALTDDELMRLEARLYDSLEEHDRDVVLLAAVDREVHGRAMAACSIWKRWRRPAECKKWLDHMKLIEEKASDLAREIFSR